MILMAALSSLVEHAENAAVRKLVECGELSRQDVEDAVSEGIIGKSCLTCSGKPEDEVSRIREGARVTDAGVSAASPAQVPSLTSSSGPKEMM